MTPSLESFSLTRAQVREIDRRAIEEYGIPGIVLMENAGRNAARIIRRTIVEKSLSNPRVAIVCGGGNNGGDGYVIARHLHNCEISVEIFTAASVASLAGDAAMNAGIIQKMKLPLVDFHAQAAIAANTPRLHATNLIVDAVLGTGFSGEVRPPLDAVVHAINAAPESTRIAIDVPSGLDCDSGKPSNATVRASMTISFVARKIGFDAPGAAEFTGNVVVADIGAPIELVHAVRQNPSRRRSAVAGK